MNSDRTPDRRELDQDELELAALYALSALSKAEMDEVERKQRERREFWLEVRSLRDAAAGLAESGPRARPRRDLWPDIQARVRSSEDPRVRAGGPAPAASAQPWRRWPGDSGSEAILRASEGAFEPTDIPGITARRLFVDEPADRVTMLVRMAPGSAYPAHRHAAPEECYVLEGDLEVGEGTELHEGDYQRMDAGSRHPVQSTRGGCLLLLTSSRRDELLG